jgi:hypothetical protein
MKNTKVLKELLWMQGWDCFVAPLLAMTRFLMMFCIAPLLAMTLQVILICFGRQTPLSSAEWRMTSPQGGEKAVTFQSEAKLQTSLSSV